jgi:tol-pal system protein YbgF
MKPITTLTCALALSCLVSAPAAAQNRQQLQMAAEMRIMLEQQQQLAVAVAQLSAQLAESMKALAGRIDGVNSTIQKSFADQASTMKAMADDISIIRTRTQDTTTRLGELREEIDALRTSLPSLSQAAPLPTPTDPLDPNAAPPVSALPTAPAAPSTAGLSPTRMFMQAEADYAAGQFSLAISGFDQLIRTFPQSEKADDAQYYIGDAQYALSKFEDAIAAYNAVIQNYPRGDQAHMAAYKRGLAQERLGQLEGARASYEQAVKTYPETQGAQMASQRLKDPRLLPVKKP